MLDFLQTLAANGGPGAFVGLALIVLALTMAPFAIGIGLVLEYRNKPTRRMRRRLRRIIRR